MESKWPFIMIVFGLLLGLAYTMVSLQRDTVINNWTTRRCDLPVMVGGSFFKPDMDPRTPSDFARDNFNFCMKAYVDQFMSLFTGPINLLFGKQLNVATGAAGVFNNIREISTNLYNGFVKYTSIFFDRFTSSVFELSRITQYLRMAVNRANAMAISMIYTGITFIRGFLNGVQYVAKVIMIVAAIMLAIIIILILILWPFIPAIIMPTLAVIILMLIGFAPLFGILGSMMVEANNLAKGFCFATDTMVNVTDSVGNIQQRPVQDILVGDELVGGGRVTAVVQMDGKKIDLYRLYGVDVSGSHLVKGKRGEWHSVDSHEDAVQTDRISPILYCFNTTTNTIPIYCPDTAETLWFRDWEEIGNEDEKGQYIWNYFISSMLNENKNYTAWKGNLKMNCDLALVGKKKLVKTSKGFIPISELSKPFGTVLDRHGKEQAILGIIHAEVEDGKETDGAWNTEHYEDCGGKWVKGARTVRQGSDTLCGMALITETGEYILWDDAKKKEVIVRDFTEIGYDSIHKTYPFVEARLRTTESSHSII